MLNTNITEARLRVYEAVRILMDNGIDQDDAWVIAEAIWDAYRSDPFPECVVRL